MPIGRFGRGFFGKGRNFMLILASASPRRKELLELANYEFRCIPSDAEENMDDFQSVEQLTMDLAALKARDVFRNHPNDVVIGADTVVAIDGKVLGKPKDQADARRMLEMLSGREHRVSTGVAICSPRGEEIFCVSAGVEFYPLSAREISDYVASGEPMDKAGAYGIQGLGALLIKGICGDYYTVMGLPIAELSRRLKNHVE